MLLSQEVKIILLLTFLTGSFCFGGSFNHDESRYTKLNVVFVFRVLKNSLEYVLLNSKDP